MASITSLGIGSGLDLNGLLGQLQQAERAKLEPIEQQRQEQQVQISAYGETQGALSGFESAANRLNDPSLFEGRNAEVTGSAVQAAADNEAAPGEYGVTVDQLAAAGSLATQRVDDPSAEISSGATDLDLTFEDAALNTTVNIAADSTLEDIRDAVNADPEAAVSASVINDGEGYRLALMSEETGEQASITGTNFDAVADQATLSDATVTQAGQDANLEVNGIAITSTTNQVEGAIQGVTLDLQQQGSSTVTVTRDDDSIHEAVTDFVDAYNELRDTTGRLTAFNGAEGEPGALIGDSAVRMLESSLRSDLAAGVSVDGEQHLLSDMGLSLAVDGTLNLDAEQLDTALADDPDSVAGFFTGDSEEGGLAGRLSVTAGQLLDQNGALERSISGAENRIDSLNDRYELTEQRIEQTIDRYRTQFGQLDSMMAEMNQTSAFLTQQLSQLGGSAGGDSMG
ncbi:flagellar filament capping protein FliD [Halomonas campisalis]|uniref:Flagellar hook-associated protein 2 n=1 Tax=Billgrantia campisalis TaxID=74661 RepID=A0ABS9P368_9GAMM|nr:flagellar filament capping protein FliD [Halomonas campisalis]MCG6656236.1 flagellar filament capping protein FliD [Halomonas campisalis]MDR5861423.1 flagellar filament capping protein FliD [Halomonas campisalis]